MENGASEFLKLMSVMKRLRAPGGCPWDRRQTCESLRPHIVEEAYELADAIGSRSEEDGDRHIVEECGDLLLQVVFIAAIGEEEGRFTIDDICRGISDKLIRRHPRIFAGVGGMSAEEALGDWEAIKRREKRSRRQTDLSVLSGVPRALPPLLKAFRIQGKAAGVGFDWPKDDQTPAVAKIGEELGEVEDALKRGDREEIAAEIGDLIFAAVNLARRLEIDPGDAVSKTNAKFERRFRYIERKVEDGGGDWKKFSLDELERFWSQAKKASL